MVLTWNFLLAQGVKVLYAATGFLVTLDHRLGGDWCCGLNLTQRMAESMFCFLCCFVRVLTCPQLDPEELLKGAGVLLFLAVILASLVFFFEKVSLDIDNTGRN